MKMLRCRARRRCPIKRHDVKWPVDAPVCFLVAAPVVAASVRCGEFRRVAEAHFSQVKFEPDADALSRASGPPVRYCRTGVPILPNEPDLVDFSNPNFGQTQLGRSP